MIKDTSTRTVTETGELSLDELDRVSGGNKVLEFLVTYVATKILDAASGPFNPGTDGVGSTLGGKIKQIQQRQ